jgi:isocitrate dehydrogenase
VANNVHNAWLRTIEDGVHTYDIFKDGISKQKVGTQAFAQAVVDRLGQKPQTLPAVNYNASNHEPQAIKPTEYAPMKKDLLGVDIFLHWKKGTADQLGEQLSKLVIDGLTLRMISNRGQKVWPNGMKETFCTDHWRCRFLQTDGGTITHQHILDQMAAVAKGGFDFIKTENLVAFDGERAYTLGQGE